MSRLKSLRAMSYNIRFDCPSDGPFRWVHRSHMVSSMVLFHKADIVGMQEVLLHQLQDLDTMFKNNYKWVGAGREDGAMGGEFVPIFYKASKLELLDSGSFWLSETPTVPGSRSWGSACPRMATWGLFHPILSKSNPASPSTSKTCFMFVNTHLDHMSEEARIEGVKLIKKMVANELSKRHDSQKVGVVVVGDFNATENSAPIQSMTTLVSSSDSKQVLKFQNAKEISDTPHHGPVGTFTGFKFEVKPPILIDYMFTSSGIGVLRHGVLADTFGEGYAPSDHRPVVCDFTLPQV